MYPTKILLNSKSSYGVYFFFRVCKCVATCMCACQHKNLKKSNILTAKYVGMCMHGHCPKMN